MGHCTSHDLKNHFNERRSDLNPNKILQVSMDGPSINLEFYRDVQSNREELELPKRSDIGSFSLHTIQGAFKSGVESTDWEIKKTFKGCLPYFTILLLEEVSTPASLEALYSQFHFVQPGGSRTKMWRKD